MRSNPLKALGSAALGDLSSALYKEPPENEKVINIHPDEIEYDNDQPRNAFDDEYLNELMLSIEKHKQLQPIIVRPKESGKYKVVIGEQRCRAIALSKKIEFVKATIKSDDLSAFDTLSLQVSENEKRRNLNPVDLADAYITMCDLLGDRSQKECAQLIGIDYSLLNRYFAIKDAPSIVKDAARSGTVTDLPTLVSMTKAYDDNPEAVVELIDNIKNGNTQGSVRSLAADIARAEPPISKKPKPNKDSKKRPNIRFVASSPIRFKLNAKNDEVELTFKDNRKKTSSVIIPRDLWDQFMRDFDKKTSKDSNVEST